MARTSTSRYLTTCVAATIIMSMFSAACGSDDAASDQLPEPDVPATSPATPPATDTPADVPASDGRVIGTANLNGALVDPKPHPIDEFVIAESYPEQIQIAFTGADPNCTAADARAVADGDVVRIELEVGLTEDALTRSCVAGEFAHNMSIALTEGLDGRTVTLGV